jgi:enamine deaminase RidA (YjgF/YER057c/UK114 family)
MIRFKQKRSHPIRAAGTTRRVAFVRLNPDDLHSTPGYHHVTVVEAGRQAHLAGQCPLDREGRLVGAGDLTAQIDQVVANTLLALAAVGAEAADVIRTVIWVTSSHQADLAAAWSRFRASPLADAFTTASTLVGVTCLGYPDQLVELDVTVDLPS